MATLPLSPTSWGKEHLPEFLLIDAACNALSWERAPHALNRLCDLLDPLFDGTPGAICTGLISSLGSIPVDRREDACAIIRENGLEPLVVPEDLKHALAQYPECPVDWLIQGLPPREAVDADRGLDYLQNAIVRLYDPRDVYATRCRMVPLSRLLQHGRLQLRPDSEVGPLLGQYPTELSEGDQSKVESWTRATYYVATQIMDSQQGRGWVEHFWSHNFTLSPCVVLVKTQESTSTVEHARAVIHRLAPVVSGLHSLVSAAILEAQQDTFDVDRDEVLMGLLSRQYDLFQSVARTPSLWTSGLSAFPLRTMVELLITLKWICSQSDRSLYRRYKEFSLGKLKLLQLQITDLIDDGHEELSGFDDWLQDKVEEEIWEELLPVDLGASFADKSVYAMAKETQLSHLYSMQYAPASALAHSEWSVLEREHLQRCMSPLHQFHRIPKLHRPLALDPSAVLLGGHLLAQTLAVWCSAYGIEPPGDALDAAMAHLAECIEIDDPSSAGGSQA